MKPFKITVSLLSPLVGSAPGLDSLLLYHFMKLKEKNDINEILVEYEYKEDFEKILKIENIGDYYVYCGSNAIVAPIREWTEHSSCRVEPSVMTSIIAKEEEKKVLITSGPYKMRYAPVHCILVNKIVWFGCGNIDIIEMILKNVRNIGSERSYGYGLVDRFIIEEIEKDLSIYADYEDKKFLMRSVPLGEHLHGVLGYRIGIGSLIPPYWDYKNYKEIAVPY